MSEIQRYLKVKSWELVCAVQPALETRDRPLWTALPLHSLLEGWLADNDQSHWDTLSFEEGLTTTCTYKNFSKHCNSIIFLL